ncbi:MAG: DUF6152 family protein [Pseudomonadota bacterium]
MKSYSKFGALAITGLAAIGVLTVAPVSAHHSFALYNNEVTKVFTGVVTRVNPDANHLQIFFAPMNAERTNVERGADGKPIIWAVEMTGSAAAADQGISVGSFPPGTVFSVAMHPLRSGELAGSREGGLVQCPAKTPPAPGKHCDSVTGSTPHPAGMGLAPSKG